MSKFLRKEEAVAATEMKCGTAEMVQFGNEGIGNDGRGTVGAETTLKRTGAVKIQKSSNLTIMILTAILASVVAFDACKKDPAEQSLSAKAEGSYQQPVQNIDIQTYIDIDGVEHLVVGEAVVGSYDGRIYECEATWTMQVTADSAIAMVLHAVLKPELDDMTIVVEPVMESYEISINGQPFIEGDVLEFKVDGEAFTIAPDIISALWGRIVEEVKGAFAGVKAGVAGGAAGMAIVGTIGAVCGGALSSGVEVALEKNVYPHLAAAAEKVISWFK